MKTLVASLVVLVFAFFIGCQDTITDPVSSDTNSSAVQEEASYKTVISTWPGYIRVHNYIFDPSHPQLDNVLLNGMIKYKIESKATIKDDVSHGYKLSLFVNVEVISRCPHQKSKPTVTAFANENIDLASTSEIANYFEKVFEVSNNCCGKLKLVLKFAFYGDQLTLVSTVLRPLGWDPATTSF